MGEAAVTCFLQGVERHGDKYYDITGSESTSMADVAAILTKAGGGVLAHELCARLTRLLERLSVSTCLKKEVELNVVSNFQT